ncbi:TPA: hypothetical protein N0F65_002386 [Lagenidium giganteum]|uniref:Protein kinase domain-containing protein n=1 Tax=Lagenidium giganteum TaxID=4803 RepID=A0AAV2YN17_9STRA|nr:TPA: hypothetical protein N0F65_002386 [Lagenidium giganteum]
MGVVCRYERLESLRASIFGEILLCRDTETSEEVIVKTVDLSLALKQKSRTNEAVQENVLKEIDVLSQLCAMGGHPNVIKLRNYYVESGGKRNFLHVVLDYCEGGDLLDSCMPPSEATDEQEANTEDQRVEEAVALGYLKDVLEGLCFLHKNGVAHRDLSLENILLRDGRAVIADFGLCARQEPYENALRCNEIVGKHYYMAPEVVAQCQYDPMKADIWSAGISFFILLTTSPPFEMASKNDAGFRYVAKHGIKAVFKAWGLGESISSETQDLLAQMLTVNAENRVSVEELLSHAAFASISPSTE